MMASLGRSDYQRIGELIFHQIQMREFDVCLSLIRLMRMADESFSDKKEELFEKTADRIKQVLITERQRLDDEIFGRALQVFEEVLTMKTITLEEEGEKAGFDEEVFLSTGQVAEKLAVSPQTVLNMIQDGRIKAERPTGTHYKIPASQFKERERQKDDLNQAVQEMHRKYAQKIRERNLENI